MLNRHAVKVVPEALGSAAFKVDYGVKYAYLAGGMYTGIASKELVVAMGKAGLMAYLGTGGLGLDEIDANIAFIQSRLIVGEPYGANLLSDPGRPSQEAALVELYLRRGIRFVEASGFIEISLSLVRYRLTGVRRTQSGELSIPNRVLAKVSRPEIAETFMRPAPLPILKQLVDAGLLNSEEAELAPFVPMSNEISVEADSGGHADQGVAYALIPAMIALRSTVLLEQRYQSEIRVGATGGTRGGSRSLCAGSGFHNDRIYQSVHRRGRNQRYGQGHAAEHECSRYSLRARRRYVRIGRQGAGAEKGAILSGKDRSVRLEPACITPKQKMALIFRWYFVHATRLALLGDASQKVDYQVHCGPALGSS